MRIALINPPAPRIVFRDGYCSSSSKSGYLWHPLDLLVQSGILSGRGHQVILVDAIAARLNTQQTIDRVAAFRPQAIVGLAGDVSWQEDAEFWRKAGETFDVPLILSGDVPRHEPERTFREIPNVTAIMSDFSTTGPATFLEDGVATEGVIGPDGKRTPVAGRMWSSAPARHDLLDQRTYRLPFHGGMAFASVLSSYGCPFSCTFCNTGTLGYRLRPVDEVIEELKLVSALGYQRVYLRDATANGHRQSLLNLCHAWKAAQLDLEWNVFCTFRPFDAELASAMASAGCRIVQFGIETDSETLRATTGKAFANEAAYAAVRYAHEAGIKVCGHFVLGLPGQGVDDVIASGSFARKLDLDYASFNLAAARPGTGLRTKADELGLQGGDASTTGFVAGLADVPTETLQRLRREAILRFYLRPRPLRAVIPDLRTKAGWSQLKHTAQALVRTF